MFLNAPGYITKNVLHFKLCLASAIPQRCHMVNDGCPFDSFDSCFDP